MRKMLLLSIWLFSVTRCEEPKIQVSGQEGGQVHISCPYGSGYENYPKCFKKGIYAYRKTIITSTDTLCKQTQDRKYDLCDDTEKRILHVTIYNLNLRDAGTYWCEIDAYTFDPKTEVELKVQKASVKTTVETITVNQQQSTRTTVAVHVSGPAVSSTQSEDEQTGKKLYLGVAAAALLLVLLVFLFLILRNHRLHIVRNSLFFSTLSFNKVTDCSAVTHSTIRHQTTD
ncbi:CMRF35-like molecule 9 [Scomber scombrus]|uniref:CMRF35-like molecule 9 n=1 Tax=Scomber scombrus TaxID=13677 RepID=A0AAV1P9E5_SCOSC